MVQEALSRAGKTLMLKEAFYGFFLIGLNKKIRKDLPTAGVSKNGIGGHLSVNPDFYMQLTEDQRIGILKHELLHISTFITSLGISQSSLLFNVPFSNMYSKYPVLFVL